VATADAEKLAALKFSEGLACEAIVRHLEGREKGVLSDVEKPESEQTPLPAGPTRSRDRVIQDCWRGNSISDRWPPTPQIPRSLAIGAPQCGRQFR
jgi:hypothetical protein